MLYRNSLELTAFSIPLGHTEGVRLNHTVPIKPISLSAKVYRMLWGNAITCTVTLTQRWLRHPGCRCQADAASSTAAAGDMRRCRHHRGRRLHLSALQMNAENIFLRLAAAHLTHFGRQFTFSWFLFFCVLSIFNTFSFSFGFFLFVGATSGTATPAGLLHG